MLELTRRAEELITHVEAMRSHAEAIRAYCTDWCEKCPLKKICNWDGDIEYMNPEAVNVERIADYINFADKFDARKELEEATENDEWIWSNYI